MLILGDNVVKLYHATQSINAKSISTDGIEPMTKDECRCPAQILDSCGIYGFVDINDAHEFAWENTWSQDYAIFTFEVSDDILTTDPEYDGESMFVETTDNITAVIVFDEFAK